MEVKLMNDILLRIREVFQDSGKNQTQIGKDISKTPQYIWRLLNVDDINPSDSVIKDICRVYEINEQWLRTGKGKKEAISTPDERFAANIGKLQRTDDETIIRWVNMIAETKPDVLKDIEKFMKKLLDID